jgi:O-antigen polysaccharide polymerase Wzy
MTTMRGRIAALQALLFLCIVTTAAILVSIGLIGVNICVWIAAGLMVGLLLISWRNFDRGRHPCFLFLGMLLIFQAGRLLGFIFGIIEQPMRIAVQAPYPISISSQSSEITLLAIILSSVCIYMPCAMSYHPSLLTMERRPTWLGALYIVIGFTVPFAFYKNIAYLIYIRAHGGYIAVFTNNAAVLAQAGLTVRVVALLGPAALIIAYIFETRRPMAQAVFMTYVLLATMGLVIGMRGKFFSEMVTIWYLHNLKYGRGFRLVGLTASGVAASLVATWVAAFREERIISFASPIRFLALQGVSMNVTEAAVAFRHTFGRFALNYLFNGFWNGLRPTVSLEQGHLWTTDLSMFLNPAATRMGYGTASSYLAELFLLAGLPAVVLGSLLIGVALAALHRASSKPWGAVLAGLVLPSLIYLPRLELLDPLAALLKGLVSMAIVYGLVVICQQSRKMAGWIAPSSYPESQSAQ